MTSELAILLAVELRVAEVGVGPGAPSISLGGLICTRLLSILLLDRLKSTTGGGGGAIWFRLAAFGRLFQLIAGKVCSGGLARCLSEHARIVRDPTRSTSLR